MSVWFLRVVERMETKELRSVLGDMHTSVAVPKETSWILRHGEVSVAAILFR